MSKSALKIIGIHRQSFMEFTYCKRKIISNRMSNGINKALSRTSPCLILDNCLNWYSSQNHLPNRINLNLTIFMSQFSTNRKWKKSILFNFLNSIKDSYFIRNKLIKFIICLIHIKLGNFKILILLFLYDSVILTLLRTY